MTTLGARKMLVGQTFVDSVGFGPNDGWTEVGRLKWSEIPGTNQKLAFMVWGRMGSSQALAGNTGPVQMQVCLGDQTGPTEAFRYRGAANLAYGPYVGTRGNPSLAGEPFFFLVVLDGVTANNWAGVFQWQTGTDFVLYARLFNNGSTGFAGEFVVTDVCFLALDLDGFGAGSWQNAQVTSGGFLNNATAGWGTLLAPAPVFPGSLGEEWLHFYYLENQPGPAASARIQFGDTTDPSLATFAPLVGENKLGWAPRGPSAQNGSGVISHYGGFSPAIVRSASGYQVAVRGQEQTGTASVSLVGKVRVFSVKASRFGVYRSRLTGTGPLRDLTSAWAAEPPIYTPVEIQVPSSTAYTLLVQGIVGHEGGTRTLGYAPWIYSNNGTVIGESGARIHPISRSVQEGVPLFEMVNQGVAGGAGPQGQPSSYQIRWNGRILTPTETENLDVWDPCAVGFFLDDTITNLAPSEPQPLAPVVVAPGKESLDAGSLNTLPIAPDMAATLDDALPVASHTGDTGYRRTWPIFSGARSFERWTWRGLVLADRDTLDAFILANPTFAYIPPEETVAVAFGVSSLLDWEDSGDLHSASVTVARLLNTGP